MTQFSIQPTYIGWILGMTMSDTASDYPHLSRIYHVTHAYPQSLNSSARHLLACYTLVTQIELLQLPQLLLLLQIVQLQLLLLLHLLPYYFFKYRLDCILAHARFLYL